MSENNYGALMMKSTVGVSDDIDAILSPGIYPIPPSNTSSPDSEGGILVIHTGTPIRRSFISDSTICLTSTHNGNAWTAWKGPLARTNPFADIKADGAAAVAEALSNLGLGWGPSGTFAIGMPFHWANAKMPNELFPEWADMTFLKWNGATFSATTFPKLALIIPSLTLVESRGEFIRNWDDGRGVDAGRTLLSAQGDAIRNITGSFVNDASSYNPTGAFKLSGNSSIINAPLSNSIPKTVNFSAADDPGVVTANENRPRSVAFNFLVRAA